MEERIARSGIPYTFVRTLGEVVDAPGKGELAIGPRSAKAAGGQLSRNEVAQL